MKNNKSSKKLLDKKTKIAARLDKIRANLEMEKLRAEKMEQDLLAVEKEQKEEALRAFDTALSQHEIEFVSLDQEMLLQLIVENKVVLIREGSDELENDTEV